MTRRHFTGQVPLWLTFFCAAVALLGVSYYVVAQTISTTTIYCGNGRCDSGETSATCSVDCSYTAPNTMVGVCGNQICESNETSAICPIDCQTAQTTTNCGNGTCDSGETSATCLRDCPMAAAAAYCGNKVCDSGESVTACPADCQAALPTTYCGNQVCDGTESYASCPTDCRTNASAYCGDRICSSGETSATCAGDCPPTAAAYCGDKVCASSENIASCPGDCQAMSSCGDGRCDSGETTQNCSRDCPAATNVCGNQICENSETIATCAVDCRATTTAYCGNRICDSGETNALCPSDCPIVTGNFCGNKICDSGETSTNCPNDCVAVVPMSLCGNGRCDSGETTQSCLRDCPAATMLCGNRNCDSGETTLSCPVDCPAVATLCGNAICDNGESTITCPKDCQPAVICGNARCESGETAQSCPRDCQLTIDKSACGNRFCDRAAGENEQSCTADCAVAAPAAPVVPPYLPPDLCRQKGFTDKVACDAYLRELSFPKTTEANKQPIVIDNRPETTAGNGSATPLLPELCLKQGLTDPMACQALMREAATSTAKPNEASTEVPTPTIDLPIECLSAGLKTSADCDVYFRKRSLAPQCLEAHIETPEECRAFMAIQSLPTICRATQALDENSCQKLLMLRNMPQACRNQQITEDAACRAFLQEQFGRPGNCVNVADETCWKMIESGNADQKYSEQAGAALLSPECVLLGIVDVAACDRAKKDKFVPEACRLAGIFEADACDRYRYAKAQEQTPKQIAADLPAECQNVGITDGLACRSYLEAKNIPRECLNSGITDNLTCQKMLAIRNLPSQCREAGIDTQEACRDFLDREHVEPACASQGIVDAVACKEFLFGRLSGVSCIGLTTDQCVTAIKQRHLGWLIDSANRMAQAKQTIDEQKTGDTFEIVPLMPGMPSPERPELVLPVAPNQARKFKVLNAAGGMQVGADDAVATASDLALVYDSDGDGVPDDIERRYGLNPQVTDSDGDGTSDATEIRGLLSAPIDRAILAGAQLGQPKLEGEIDETLRVTGVDTPTSESDTAGGLLLSGTGQPGEIVTIYVYSDIPLVMTTAVDGNGQWQYELADSLSEGRHEVYVAVNDESGGVTRKSSPISFVIAGAQAIGIAEAAVAEVQAATIGTINVEETSPASLYRKLFMLGGLLLVIVAFGAAGYIFSSKRSSTGGTSA